MAAATWVDDVPRDIWLIIFEKLGNNYLDIIRFNAVCSKFRSIASSDQKNMYHSPLLLVPREADSANQDVFTLADPKHVYQLHLPQLDNRNKYCFGSSYGWLFTADMYSRDCNLLNPVSRVQISLPRLPPSLIGTGLDEIALPLFYIRKATISADPSKDTSFVVMLIFDLSSSLYYCRPGDINWTYLPSHGLQFRDVICHMGNFYAIHSNGNLLCWKHCDVKPTVIIPGEEEWTKRNLVNSSDGSQLIMVCGYPKHPIRVFKLEKEEKKFIELQRLGDDEALFVGPHCAFIVSTLGSAHILPNCIYSATYRHWGREAIKVYSVYLSSLDDKTKKRRRKRIYKSVCERNAPCIWVIPNTNKPLHVIIKANNTMNKKKRQSTTKFGESKVQQKRKKN